MNVAIVGATGYGGIQAVNLLKNNNNYKISYLGGNKSSGSKSLINDSVQEETIDKQEEFNKP